MTQPAAQSAVHWWAGRYSLVIVLGVALLVRGAMFLIFAVHGNEAFLRSNDSGLYLTAASNLVNFGIFAELPGNPPLPSMLTMPGYPALLAAIRFIHPAPWFVALLQNLLSLGTIAVVYRALVTVAGQRTAFWATLLYGAEPFTAYQANLVMTDTVFVFLIALGLASVLTSAVAARPRRRAVAAGVCFAFATYLRILGLYFSILVAGWWLLGPERFTGRRRLASASIFVATVAALLLPWVARNGRQFGVWKLSTQPGFNLLFFHANQAIAYAEGRSHKEVRGELIEAWERQGDVFARDQFAGREARRILRKYWRTYLPVYVVKIAPFFLQSGWYDVVEVAGFPASGERVDLTGALLRGRPGVLLEAFGRRDVSTIAHLAGVGVRGVITVLVLVAPLLAWRGDPRTRGPMLLLFVFVAVTALLASPIAHARYRQSVEPWMFALAVYAILGRRQSEAGSRQPPDVPVAADLSLPAQHGADRSERDGEVQPN